MAPRLQKPAETPEERFASFTGDGHGHVHGESARAKRFARSSPRRSLEAELDEPVLTIALQSVLVNVGRGP